MSYENWVAGIARFGVYGYMKRKEPEHDLDSENKSMWNEAGMQPAH